MSAGPAPDGRAANGRAVALRGSALRAVALEAAGVGVALVVGLAVLAHLAASPRSFLLFTDGDSVQLALIHSSLRVGEAQDWAMSAVLFLPELAVYLAVAAVVAEPRAALAVAGLLGWLACYGGFRVAAGGIRMPRRTRVLGAVVGIGLLGAMALTESSPDRNALQPASLQLTTTYYVATVAASLVSVGCVARMLDRPARAAAVALGLVTAVSVLSNPIAIAWTVLPLALLAALTLRAGAPPRRAVLVGAVLATGVAVGLLGRIPLAHWIAETGEKKVRPDKAAESAGYYAGLLRDRLGDPAGWAELLLVLALVVLGGVLLGRALRARRPAEAVLAGSSVITPLVVVAGAILLGTDANRYLQPVVFLTPLAVLPVLAGLSVPRTEGRRAIGLTAALGLALAATGVGAGESAAASVARPDPAVACVVRWVDRSGQYGAGQYWTVRAPKAYLADPRRLLQTDSALNGYAWLVDRADLTRSRVTFLLSSPDSPAFTLPDDAQPGSTVDCGRYTITEYPAGLTLGPAHS